MTYQVRQGDSPLCTEPQICSFVITICRHEDDKHTSARHIFHDVDANPYNYVSVCGVDFNLVTVELKPQVI